MFMICFKNTPKVSYRQYFFCIQNTCFLVSCVKKKHSFLMQYCCTKSSSSLFSLFILEFLYKIGLCVFMHMNLHLVEKLPSDVFFFFVMHISLIVMFKLINECYITCKWFFFVVKEKFLSHFICRRTYIGSCENKFIAYSAVEDAG